MIYHFPVIVHFSHAVVLGCGDGGSRKLFKVEVDADWGVDGKDVAESGALLNATGGGSFEESEHGFVAANLQVCSEVQLVARRAIPLAIGIPLVLYPFRSARVVVLALANIPFSGLFLIHAVLFLPVPLAVTDHSAIDRCLHSFPLRAGGLWSALSPPAFKVLHDLLNSVSQFLKSFLGVHDCISNVFKSVTDVIQELFERRVDLVAPGLTYLMLLLGFFIIRHPAVFVALVVLSITEFVRDAIIGHGFPALG